MKRIIAADDNSEALYALKEVLEIEGYSVEPVENGKEVLAAAKQQAPDLFLLDVMMPQMTGVEALQEIRRSPKLKSIPVILLTSMDSFDDIRLGIESGASDYVSKPFERKELLTRIACCLEFAEGTTDEPRDQQDFGIIGESDSKRRVIDAVESLKESDVPVLITGETGTGKELVARAIHISSERSTKPFLALNCSAFNETLLESELFGHGKGAFTGAIKDKVGMFEAAHGGTIFLDELGEMPASIQAKLLRVLQDGTFFPVGSTVEKRVDVRIVAATHRNIEVMIQEGDFREDLYYRLNVSRVFLDPLRDRPADIPLLMEAFLEEETGRAVSLSSEALKVLLAYSWPGNIRELKNEAQRIKLVLGKKDAVSPSDLSQVLFSASQTPSDSARSNFDPLAMTLKEAIQQLEVKILRAALSELEGNKSEVARRLDISRSSLISKVKQYGIED